MHLTNFQPNFLKLIRLHLFFSQRYQFFIGIIFFLTLGKSESAKFQAICVNIPGGYWMLDSKNHNLETCSPEIQVVTDEDFKISSDGNSSIQAVSSRDKRGVQFLPINLQDFPELILFDTIRCSLTSIKDQFKGLSKLMFLSLEANKIENVAGDAFKDLVDLEWLDLSYNQIYFLRKETFASLKEVRRLKLGYNKIQYLHAEIFSSLVEVTELSLYDNEIQSLDENIFMKLTSLYEIYLSKNNLTRIPKDLFKNNLNLHKIWLNDNKISSIDYSMFDHLRLVLRKIEMKKNSCVDDIYRNSTFEKMRSDLKEHCIVEVTVKDLQKLLEAKLGNVAKRVELSKRMLLFLVFFSVLLFFKSATSL